MRADGHRTAAEDIERSLALLGDPAALPFIRRLLIEAYFGSAFHWIAYGMQNAHGKHKENHSKLPTYLDSFGEHQMSQSWQQLESIKYP